MVQKNSEFIDFTYTLFTSVVLCYKYRHAHKSHSVLLRKLFCYVCQITVTIILGVRFSARLCKSEPQTNPAALSDL